VGQIRKNSPVERILNIHKAFDIAPLVFSIFDYIIYFAHLHEIIEIIKYNHFLQVDTENGYIFTCKDSL